MRYPSCLSSEARFEDLRALLEGCAACCRFPAIFYSQAGVYERVVALPMC